MRDNPGGSKKKSVKINSPSNPMENKPAPKPSKAKTGPGFRGNVRGDLSLEELKKRKAKRDAAKKPAAAPKGGSKSSSGSKKGSTKPKKNTPKKTKATPPAPTKVDPKPLVNTKKTGEPVTGTAFNNNIVEQERDILNAFLAFSGTELFQYTNERSVDGMFSDVSIISVLSSRRKDYSPNDIINLYPPFIKSIYRGEGADLNKLYFDIEGYSNGGTIVVDFYIGDGINTIGSVDFV